jgi:histone H2B
LQYSKKKSTLSAKHVQVATKMVFPSEMGGMAVSEGTKALTKFLASKR